MLHKHGDKLYNGLADTVRAHLRKMASDVESANDASFLELLNKKWADHKLSMIMIRDILMYMVCARAPARSRVGWRACARPAAIRAPQLT